jgi:hypothetical protein
MQEISKKRQYKLHGIELISFSIQPQSPDEYTKEVFKFNIQQEQKTSAEKKVIIIFILSVFKVLDMMNRFTSIWLSTFKLFWERT